MPTPDLIFLKLGGSLITDKDQPNTPRPEVLARLAAEIARASAQLPAMQLIIGHGSGSFGHVAAKRHATRQGVRTSAQWRGFAEVWQSARALNQLVLDALLAQGLPVIAFPPSAAIIASAGQIQHWNLEPIQRALTSGLIPLVNGDVVFDSQIGGTVLSTEDVFLHLALQLSPRRILLAGLEAGVWADFPTCHQLIERITPANINAVRQQIGASVSVDVTGGMLQKVDDMLSLTAILPEMETQIFSGVQPGALEAALSGGYPGTTLASI